MICKLADLYGPINYSLLDKIGIRFDRCIYMFVYHLELTLFVGNKYLKTTECMKVQIIILYIGAIFFLVTGSEV